MATYRGDRNSIGSMRDLITIQKRIVGQNAQTGEPTETWEDFRVRVPSKRHTRRGSELATSNYLQVIADVVFRIRFIEGINEQMRIRFKEQSYNIVFVDDVQDGGRFLDLLTKVEK